MWNKKKHYFLLDMSFFHVQLRLNPTPHGTFKDCEALLSRVAEMGFDTLYFPPIRPIGEVNRKGKNNATTAQAGDVGSPWGISSYLGGHKSTHLELALLMILNNWSRQHKTLELRLLWIMPCKLRPIIRM